MEMTGMREGDGESPETQTPREHDITCSPVAVVSDGKYVVFKVEDFLGMMGQLALPPWWIPVDDNDCDVEHVYGENDWRPSERPSFHEHLEGTNWDCAVLAAAIVPVVNLYAIPDATVIRGQDLFAASTLHSYASAITTAIEVMIVSGENVNGELVQTLRDKADFFHTRAMMSEQAIYKKLPD